jgi:hypothetical protein
LKLWHEKRSLITEKWDKLFEINFIKEDNDPNDEIVDFDILDSQVLNGIQQITIVIFTAGQKQYIYQIESKFLNGLQNITTFGLIHNEH